VVATELIDLGGDFAEPFGVDLGVQHTSMLRPGAAAGSKGERGLARRAKPALSDVVPDLAQGDAVDPGPELLILSQTVKLRENRQQRVLHDILGCVGVQDRAQSERIQPLAHYNSQMPHTGPAARASLTEQFFYAFVVLTNHNKALIRIKAAGRP